MIAAWVAVSLLVVIIGLFGWYYFWTRLQNDAAQSKAASNIDDNSNDNGHHDGGDVGVDDAEVGGDSVDASGSDRDQLNKRVGNSSSNSLPNC